MPIFQVTPLSHNHDAVEGAVMGGFEAKDRHQLSEIQKTLGSIDAKLDQHKDAMAKQESDIGKIKADVAEFKQIRHTAKVLGWVGGVVLAGMLAVTGFVVKEVWTVLKPLAVQQIQAPGATQSK